jgi:thiamine pyrophosphokinase
MASLYPLLNKLVNSFVVKAIRDDPMTKTITSLFSTKETKDIVSENHFDNSKSSITTSEKALTNAQVTLRESAKVKENAESRQRNYTISTKFLDTFEKENDTEIFLIYLNRPFDMDVLSSLHKISSCTIMADGGANRFYDKLKKNSFKNEIIPHALVGDFDSIREDVMEYYREKDVTIFRDPSQDDTDLEKCLRFLYKRILDQNSYTRAKFYRIVITGALGGRLDHTLNNIHILHKFAQKYPNEENISLHLMDDNSIGTCILPGKTRYIRSSQFEENAGCGIFPLLGEEAKVQTKGLKWNLDQNTPALSFKSFVSSSNEMLDEVIEFETDKMLFWTTTNRIHRKECDDQ